MCEKSSVALKRQYAALRQSQKCLKMSVITIKTNKIKDFNRTQFWRQSNTEPYRVFKLSTATF